MPMDERLGRWTGFALQFVAALSTLLACGCGMSDPPDSRTAETTTVPDQETEPTVGQDIGGSDIEAGTKR